MRCPYCAHPASLVKDSRPSGDNEAIRRRRQCEDCGARFTTFERVQMREIVVLKSGGRRECFDRAKLGRAVALACRKRAIARERIDRLVAGVQRRISESGSGEVSTQAIGEMVMEALRDLDPVAYIRYASLQQAFSDPRDFERCASALRAARHP